jgi:cell division septal protein FtsQ
MSVKKSSRPSQGSQRLLARRRLRRRRSLIGLGVFFVLLLLVGLWLVHQRAFRIQNVTVFGAPELVAAYAREEMAGSHVWIFPRDSVFFLPTDAIRSRILAERPEIAAVSVFTSDLTTLTIKVDERTSIARWCGEKVRMSGDRCYVFDANGYIFAEATSTEDTINTFGLYAPLAESDVTPLRATIAGADLLPDVFEFSRELRTFGSPVEWVHIHDGEVDQILKSGTRITYVLGEEQSAFTTLTSGKASINVSDGSIDYVDLRFGNKMYVKRHQKEQEATE